MTIERFMAQRGALFLDERCPNWFSKIDIKTLDLGSCEQCVLGQLFGSYADGLAMLYSDSGVRDDAEFGFATDEIDGDEYPRLSTAWKLEIKYRLRRQRSRSSLSSESAA